MGIGKNMTRVDAKDKVTGEARYTADLEPKGLLTAKVVRSTIANGVVKSFDLSEALAVPGGCEDCHMFRCAGYPIPHSRPSMVRGDCPPGHC